MQKDSIQLPYIPQVGDLFIWGDTQYWCIESSSVKGVVNPISETFYVKDFYWCFDGEYSSRFVRRATPFEWDKMGIVQKKINTALQELASWVNLSLKLEGYEHKQIIDKCHELFALEKQQIITSYLRDKYPHKGMIVDANVYYERVFNAK